jgi:hypothetical protein
MNKSGTNLFHRDDARLWGLNDHTRAVRFEHDVHDPDPGAANSAIEPYPFRFFSAISLCVLGGETAFVVALDPLPLTAGAVNC